MYGIVNFLLFCICVPKIVFILANSAHSDEMPPYATFNLGLHCLPKYLFTGIQNEICFPLSDWDLTSWLSTEGVSYSTPLPAYIAAKMVEELGLSVFMLDSPCYRTEGLFNLSSSQCYTDGKLPLTIYALMDLTFWSNTINLGWPFVYIEESQDKHGTDMSCDTRKWK